MNTPLELPLGLYLALWLGKHLVEQLFIWKCFLKSQWTFFYILMLRSSCLDSHQFIVDAFAIQLYRREGKV